jgi:hypothetical protein
MTGATGASGDSPQIQLTKLLPGDPNCSYGGEQIDVGAAGDAGAQTAYVCNGAPGTVTDAGIPATCMPGATPTGGQTYSGTNATGIADDNYSYVLQSTAAGTGTITVYGVDAEFSANWINSLGQLAGVGLVFDETRTASQIGTLTATFSETKSGGGGTFSAIGVHGWTVTPLHEYYIIDDWFGTRPVPGTKVGEMMIDGGTYDVLLNTQVNQPTILGGNATFVQVFSVRQTPRSCGTITVSDHFSGWTNFGIGVATGQLEEARIVSTVSGGSSGHIVFTAATVTTN